MILTEKLFIHLAGEADLDLEADPLLKIKINCYKISN